MEAAYRDVVEDAQLLREMSRLPLETLRRRVNGTVMLGCKPGPATILTDEEDPLCYQIEISDMGYGLTKEDVQRLVWLNIWTVNIHLQMEWQVVVGLMD